MRRGTLILIVVLVLVLIGAGYWAFTALSAPADDGAGPEATQAALPTLMGEGPESEEPQAQPTLEPLPTLMGDNNTPVAPAYTATPEVMLPTATPQSPAATFTPMPQPLATTGQSWITLPKAVDCLMTEQLPGNVQLGYVQSTVGAVQVVYYSPNAGLSLDLDKVHQAQACMGANAAWIVTQVFDDQGKMLGEAGWRWDYTEALKGSNPSLREWFLGKYLDSAIRVEFYYYDKELPFETTAPLPQQ